MPKRLLLPLLLFCFFQSGAQKDYFDPENCPIVYATPGKFSVDKTPFPFSEVVVVDSRFDTSKLGYARASAFKISIIKTKTSFAETIGKAIAVATEDRRIGDTSKKLLVVIRHLWLEGQPSNPSFKSACTASLDVYYKNGAQFSPLFKIDTLFGSAKALLRADEDLLVAPFQFCLKKLSGISLDQAIATRRKLTEQDITAFYQQRINNVQPKGDSVSKGVFLTFKDFLQNRPAYTDFRVSKHSMTDDIYLIEDGRETLLSKFWGYCDGKNSYIKLGHNLFPLHKQNNAYDVYGANEVQHNGVAKSEGLVSPSPTGIAVHALDLAIKQNTPDKLVMRAMQLNMETGKPY